MTLSEIAMWSPRALTALAAAVVLGTWLGLTSLYLLFRVATQWLIDHAPEPRRGPGLNPHVPLPEYAARQHASLAQLIDIASPQQKPGCGCTFWDGEADRAEWVPCGDHLEAMIRDGRSS